MIFLANKLQYIRTKLTNLLILTISLANNLQPEMPFPYVMDKRIDRIFRLG